MTAGQRTWQGLALAALVLSCMMTSAQGTFRGDPVQMFKRMRFGDQRTMWSDVIVGQGPLFEVDRAIELPLPTDDWMMSSTAVKLQLSYDHEKHTSEWLTLSDGKGLLLDTLTIVFVYSGSDIKDVFHQQHFLKSPEGSAPPPHQKQITVAYRWIKDTDSDTREGLNFLFVGGFALTIVAIIGVLFDSQDLTSSRALLVPEYEESGRRKPKVKGFVLFQAEEEEGREVPADEEGGVKAKESLSTTLRLRAGGGGGEGDGAGEGGDIPDGGSQARAGKDD